MNPRISVVVIFLDAERFLSQAIDSVLGQTLDDWELLLVDDGSIDASGSIARRAAAEDPSRVRFLRHADGRNRGMSASRNLGIEAATAPLVCFLDADDVYHPDRLRHHVGLFDDFPDVGMVYGPRTLWHRWDGSSDLADIVYPTGQSPFVPIDPPRLFRDYLLGRAPTPATCSVTIRRESIQAVGGAEDAFASMMEDQVLFLKLALHVRTLVTDRPLDRYRQHPDSVTARALASGAWSRTEDENDAQRKLDAWLADYVTGAIPHRRFARRVLRARARRRGLFAVPIVGAPAHRLHRRVRRTRRRRARTRLAPMSDWNRP